MEKNEKIFEKEEVKTIGLEKVEKNRKFRREIITGNIIWSLHEKQGSIAYLIGLLEPHLSKKDRSLFGLLGWNE